MENGGKNFKTISHKQHAYKMEVPTFSLVELYLCIDTVKEQVSQLLPWQFSTEHGQYVLQTLGLQVPQDLLQSDPLLLNESQTHMRRHTDVLANSIRSIHMLAHHCDIHSAFHTTTESGGA